jgi:hypothetical protein
LNAVLVAALGAAINFATNLKTSWIAWLAVALLVVATVLVTVLIDRRQAAPTPSPGTTIESSSAGSKSSEAYGLVMRTTELTNPDGSRTKTTEYFSEEVAVRVFRENFGQDDD